MLTAEAWMYKVNCWFVSSRQDAQVSWHIDRCTRWYNPWHPQSLAKTPVEQILRYLQLACLRHSTQSQEDDCSQHDYAFIRLAMHCLHDGGSAHSSLEQMLPSEKPMGGWRGHFDSCCRHFPYYDVNMWLWKNPYDLSLQLYSSATHFVFRLGCFRFIQVWTGYVNISPWSNNRATHVK